MTESLSPVSNSIAVVSLHEQIAAEELKLRLADHDGDLVLLEIVGNEHGTITVHEHLDGEHSHGYHVTVHLRGQGAMTWWRNHPYRPSALSIDKGRYAYAIGPNVYVHDTVRETRSGAVHQGIRHNLFGDVLTTAFRELREKPYLLLSDDRGVFWADLTEETSAE